MASPEKYQRLEQHTVEYKLDKHSNSTIDSRRAYTVLEAGEYRLSIEIDVETDSSELNLETNKRYELVLSPTASNELLARISAFSYFGARHGLKTLSQLIAYDEFTNQLKIRTDTRLHLKDDNFVF